MTSQKKSETQSGSYEDENAYYKQHTKELETQVRNYQQQESRPLPTPKNSPKKDTQQTRIFESSNLGQNKVTNIQKHDNSKIPTVNHKKSESRGPCRYFPKCKWGDKCKWEHLTNTWNQKPRKFNSVPGNQLRTPQYPNNPPHSYHYEFNPGPKQPVQLPINVSKPPPPLYQNPNPVYYHSGTPQMLNGSLPYQVSATVNPQNSVNQSEFVDNCNLINIPLVPCQNSYNM